MPPETAPKSSRKTVVTIAVIAVVLIAAGVFAESSHTGNSVTTTATTTPVTNPETTGSQTVGMTASSSDTGSTSAPASASTYKDGTYTATGSYNTPAGTEHVGVTLTLANDIVTSATVVEEAQAPESKRYQGQFISGYKAFVVGKDISTLNLTKVSGSSLTPQGFDDAVAQIKTQAQA